MKKQRIFSERKIALIGLDFLKKVKGFLIAAFWLIVIVGGSFWAVSAVIKWLQIQQSMQDSSAVGGILATTIVTMLGIAITSYIFLSTELHNRMEQRPYERRLITNLLSVKTHHLIILSGSGAFCILVCFCISSGYIRITDHLFGIAAVPIMFLVIYAVIVEVLFLAVFNYTIINHSNLLLVYSKKRIVELESGGGAAECEIISNVEFLKCVNDLEAMVSQMIDNHEQQVHSFPGYRKLERILSDKRSTGKDAESYAELYDKLIEYRDCLMVLITLGSGMDGIAVSDYFKGVLKKLEGEFVVSYIKGELLRDLSLSNKVFRGAVMEKTSFAKTAFYRVEFPDAKLQGVDMRGCLFQEVDFCDADCSNGNFSESKFPDIRFNTDVKFQNAIFDNADMSGIRLGNLKNFEGASFRKTNFTQADFKNVNLMFTDFSESKLFSVSLHAPNLRYANMSKAELSNAIIDKQGGERCDLYDVNLSGASLFRIKINDANMTKCRLVDASLIEAVLKNCILDKSHCMDASFNDAILDNIYFNDAVLDRADFSYAKIKNNSKFVNASLAHVSFIGIKVSDVDFTGAILRSGKFTGARFERCRFTDALFETTLIKDVVFVSCDFTGSDIAKAELFKVKFQSCTGIQKEELDENSRRTEFLPLEPEGGS